MRRWEQLLCCWDTRNSFQLAALLYAPGVTEDYG